MQQSDSNKLTRRQVIERALVFSGAAGFVGSSTLMAACSGDVVRSAPENSDMFSAAQIAWLDEVAETILPETDTPGAKAANTGAFIALMVSDTYSPEEQNAFFAGMAAHALFTRLNAFAYHGPTWGLLRPFAFAGRHSLAIYLIHQPILFAGFNIYGFFVV